MARQEVSGPTDISISSGASSVQAQYSASKTPATWSVQVVSDGSLSPGDYTVTISSTGLLTVTLSPGVVVPAPGTSLNLVVSASSGNGGGNNDSLNVSVTVDSTVVPCFVAGTRIATLSGEIPVEQLAAGDRVHTIDGETAKIRWVGSRKVSNEALARSPKLRPVLLPKDCFGKGLPNRDLLLSPLHRVRIGSWKTQLLFGESDLLANALHLPQAELVNNFDESIEYFHILCDQHEIVFANGVAAETLYPGEIAHLAFEPTAREKISECLVASQSRRPTHKWQAALTCLTYREARLLC